MRNSEKNKGIWERIRTTQSAIPFPVVAVLLLLLLAVEVIFTVMAVRIGILPGKYIALIIVILVAIDAGVVALLANRSCGRKRYYTGLIIAVLLAVILMPGAYFINLTSDALQKIASKEQQWEEYDVVALEEGSYLSVDDIKSREVYALGSQDKMNQEARERLITTADVDFKDEAEILALGHRLVDDKGQKNDNLIYVSKSIYEMMCENIDGFKKGTKVIYSVDVKRRAKGNDQKIDVTVDPFNIYITGIDAWGDIGNVSRSDVNMIVTVNPQNREILLTSIPRDAYVPLHSYGEMDKLTHSGIYGVDETLDTVHDWLGVDLNYYVKINFSMVVKIINAIGGIRVYSDYEFDSAIAKYHYPKGWVTLHGKSALYFARERKSFEESDEQRILNQQKVMEAVIKKVTSSKVILTSYSKLLGIVSENMETDMSDRDLAALARMQLKDMDSKWSVKTIAIDCDDASRGTFSMGMGRELFVAIPRSESVEEAKKAIHDTMYPADVDSGEGEDKGKIEELLD